MEMQFLNRVELRGLVGQCRTTLINGRQLARFTLATNIQLAEEDKCLTIETNWFSIDAWEGERITGLDRLTKGTPVHLTGRLRQIRYTDSNGFDHSQLEVIADSLTILEGKLTNETNNNNRFDVNARFQDFRDSLQAEVLNMVRKAGGRIVTSNKSGYTDKSIFLPAAGYRIYGDLRFDGYNGEFWSSSLCTYLPNDAYNLHFSSNFVSASSSNYRCYGHSVRPVSE